MSEPRRPLFTVWPLSQPCDGCGDAPATHEIEVSFVGGHPEGPKLGPFCEDCAEAWAEKLRKATRGKR